MSFTKLEFLIKTKNELRAHIARQLAEFDIAEAHPVIDDLVSVSQFLFKKNGYFNSNSPLFDYSGKISRSAALMGISKAQFVSAALKQPQLFYQAPETVARHAQLALGLYRTGHTNLTNGKISQPDNNFFLAWLCTKFPLGLSLEDNNFHLRQELASLRGAPRADNILTIPRHKVEREVASLLGHDVTQPVERGAYNPEVDRSTLTPAQARHHKLCELIERGLLKGVRFAGEAQGLAHVPGLNGSSSQRASTGPE